MPCSLSVQGNYKNVLSVSRSNGRKNEMTGQRGGGDEMCYNKKEKKPKERTKKRKRGTIPSNSKKNLAPEISHTIPKAKSCR